MTLRTLHRKPALQLITLVTQDQVSLYVHIVLGLYQLCTDFMTICWVTSLFFWGWNEYRHLVIWLMNIRIEFFFSHQANFRLMHDNSGAYCPLVMGACTVSRPRAEKMCTTVYAAQIPVYCVTLFLMHINHCIFLW